MKLFLRSTIALAVLLGIAAISFRAGRQSAIGPEPGPAAEWNVGAQMPALHIEGSAAVLNGELYCIGGFTDNELRTTARVDVYDPATDSWRSAAPLPARLSHATAVVEGDRI